MSGRRRAGALLLWLAIGCAPSGVDAQRDRDVRQIVTFLFQPGRGDSAIAIYERALIPLYRQDAAMRRFRGYREAESPEPLDLVIVSSFNGMAGMDASNLALRGLASGGRSVFQWYGVLDGLVQRHHDQFVEMRPQLGDPIAASADSVDGLTVMEYVRVAPGRRHAFERLIATRVRGVERDLAGIRWSETGRLLVSDGWDYLRIFGTESLASWQGRDDALRERGVARDVDQLVVARKTIILRGVRALSVR